MSASRAMNAGNPRVPVRRHPGFTICRDRAHHAGATGAKTRGVPLTSKTVAIVGNETDVESQDRSGHPVPCREGGHHDRLDGGERSEYHTKRQGTADGSCKENGMVGGRQGPRCGTYEG